MNLFFALCISPILVGVALLAFEYFVVQPYQDSRDLSALKFSPDVNDTWSTALRSGLKQFKHFQHDSPIAWTNDRVKVEGIRIKQDTDTAILNVRVTPRASILFFLTRIYSSMNVDGMTVPYQSKYRVNIDSSGSVKEIQLLEESEIHRTRGTASAPKRPPPNGLVLKEISEPVTEIVDGQLNVEIRFLVENWGESRTIHPVVEYKVARRYGSQFTEKTVCSPDDWIIELDPNSIKPVSFSMLFDDVNVVVLTKPPHKVSVKLITVSS